MTTQVGSEFRRPRILIVDDDQAVRKLLRFRLQGSYEILETGSPEEALALALQHKPDAILLDLMLPRYSGFEVCQTLASMSFTQLIPIFVISGESASLYKDFCHNIGAKGFFQKPIDFETLQASIDETVRGGKQERRAEVRVPLKAGLTLRGTTLKGDAFESSTVTENVSANGFFCRCSASLQAGGIVDVFLGPLGRQFCGKAKVTRVEHPGTSAQGCGFQFLGDPVDWILR
jgi:DNA-binding response OmpR family regulator